MFRDVKDGEFLHGMTEIVMLVSNEVDRAIEKHGGGIHANRDAFIRIVTEEVGEIAKSINKRENSEQLRKEIIQTIAVCVMYLRGILKDSDK